MPVKIPLPLSDVRGYSQLAIDATLGVTDIVEAVHANILCSPPQRSNIPEHTRGLTGLIYNNIRGITRLVGISLDALLALASAAFEPAAPTHEREALRAAVNGVLGDYLVGSANPLAIPMQLRRDGQPLNLTRAALTTTLPQATGKIVVLAHGLCMNDRQWRRHEHDYGAALAAEAGFTPLYLHYNSGLHISTNGRAFAALLEELLHAWPVPTEELVIIGHSLGGLVTRSACYYGAAAGHAWPAYLRKIVFLGTPHHGAPFERGGNWVTIGLGVSRYSATFARWGRFAALALPTSVTAVCWMTTGLIGIASRRPAICGAGYHCLPVCNAMSLARLSRRTKLRPVQRFLATASYRCPVRWVSTLIQPGTCRSRSRTAGSAMV